MDLIKINPTNEKYFSDDFIKGFECGAKRQFEADKKERPKEGKWFHYEGMLYCSECHAEIYNDIMEYLGDDVPKFCPNCGADMRPKESE